MWIKNKKISERQAFRLLTFDFVGVGSLILPAYLAQICGGYGLLAIAIGCIAGILYLGLLKRCQQSLQKNLDGYARQEWNKPVYIFFLGWLVLHCIVLAGFLSYVFVSLVQQSQIQQESFWLLALVILLVAGYSAFSGIESRARMYEILFFIIFVPLVVMLVLSVRQVEVEYLLPASEFSLKDTLKGAYGVFLLFGLSFWTLFFPEYMERQGKGMHVCVRKAMSFAIVLLVVVYVLALGNFGEKALASLEFPTVTLMSTIQLSGGFVKRLDILMLAVWFFTLLSLLSQHLFYAHTLWLTISQKKTEGIKKLVLLCFVFGVALLFAYKKEVSYRVFFTYLLYISTPLFVLVPILILFFHRRKQGIA